VAALVMAMRNVLLEGIPPPNSLLIQLALLSIGMFGMGLMVFGKLKRNFYDHL
jgi:ABC-type polysaccharide/polyol phosphate export permease